MPVRNLDPKTRRLLFGGNLTLVAALLLWAVVRPLVFPGHPLPGHSTLGHDLFDGLCGLLFGIAISLQIIALRAARRCRTSTL